MKHPSTITYNEEKKGSFVHSRVDKEDKAKASFILEKIGLNVSDAIRLFLKQVIMKKGLPFTVRIPNSQTIAAIESADKEENLEEITLDQLRKQLQGERKRIMMHSKKKKIHKAK